MTANDFISPHFIIAGEGKREGIHSLPGIERLSIDLLIEEAHILSDLGIKGMLLFPFISKNLKDRNGSEALNDQGLIIQAIKALKKYIPHMCVITDIALDPFTNHGHDGLVADSYKILNDETVEVLAKMSLLHAKAGVDIVAPSDMMDGRIKSIRQCLDINGFEEVNIMSYAAKFASSLYGPFRDALGSTPGFGDKKTYQLNPANAREALLEAELDYKEGADFLMVKPAILYLDIIYQLKQKFCIPVAAYHVSGEYAMAMAAGLNGWLDADKVLYESLLSIKRGGADIILTYAAKKMVRYLKQVKKEEQRSLLPS